MKFFTLAIASLLLALTVSFYATAQDENPFQQLQQQQTDAPSDYQTQDQPPQQEPEITPPPEQTSPPPQEEQTVQEETQEVPIPPTKADEERLDDEGLFQDALDEMKKLTPEQISEQGTGSRKITLDSVVVVNYKFDNPPDSYQIKYHINMSGEINGEAGMIKGNAKVATDISGYLAKTPAFECILKVSIADVPYEIIFKKTGENSADLNVNFKDQILENWESLCTFLDTSNAKFNTRGAPERWIGAALEKAEPSLSRLTTQLDPQKPTTMKFTIPKHTVQDSGLGKADVEGSGSLTISNTRKTAEEGETDSGTSKTNRNLLPFTRGRSVVPR